jgi:hypothetical protein
LAEYDRIKGALARFIRDVMSSVDYYALYPAKVVSQSGQTVDVVTDDARFGSITGVPIRTFAPDVEITVSPNARVLVGFEAGDPSMPYAALWQSGAIVSIAIAGDTDSSALTSKVDAEFVKVASALTAVSAGGGALTGANTYTAPVSVASTKLLLGG